MSKLEYRLILAAYAIGFIGILQYLGITTWLMTIYPGGRIGDKGSIGYHFFYNYLSDLGRVRGFGRGGSPTAIYYLITLSTVGASTIVFFGALGHYLFHSSRNWWAIPCALLAIVAGTGYIGIAVNPIDLAYYPHRFYVQVSFIGFWWTCVFCAIAVWKSPVFPTRYARLLVIVLIVLGLQILVMIFGARSWSSDGALVLQVTAQKVVVYTEIVVMLILNVAAIRVLLQDRSDAPVN